MSLRVCHLGKYYAPARGGIETHVQALAQGQAALGADVEVICVNHLDPQGNDVTGQPLATTRTVWEKDGPIHLVRVGRRANISGFDVCPRLPFLLHELGRRHFDVIHLHLPNPTMLLALAVQPLHARLVIAHHSDIVRQRVLRHAILPIKRRLFSQADRIVAMCEPYARSSSLLREFASKVEVIPLGLDLDSFANPSAAAQAYATRFNERYAGPLWLSVGRIVYYKALHVALEALRLVGGTFLVVGQGPLEGELRKLGQQLGVADRVVWLGGVTPDELVGAYHAATALWFSSDTRSEAFGLAQVEAMASGCPVLNCDIPGSGVPWVAPHEEAALTVAPRDPVAFAGAARRLLEDPALRNRLAAGGRQRALAEFSQKVMADRHMGLYAEIMRN